jgi:ubiquinol-cytochrome c reductase cytochrome c1 subunit
MSTLLKMMLLLGCFSVQAFASEVKLEKMKVATDKPALARGAEGLMTNCHSCHSMKYIKYRDLANLGLDKQKVDGWRGDQPLDAPVLAQMSENDAMLSFAKVPPDLSLMAQARDGGSNYVYSYLIGYYVAPDGTPGNHVFPGTRMPDPLGISGATDVAQRSEMQNTAKDIVSFLSWAADPHAGERIRLGYYVIGYLLLLTGLLYLVKKQIWSRLK